MVKKALSVKWYAGILVLFLVLSLVPPKAFATVTPGLSYRTFSRVIYLTPYSDKLHYHYIIRYNFAFQPSFDQGQTIAIIKPQPQPRPQPEPKPQPRPEPRPQPELKPEPQPDPQTSAGLTAEEQEMIDLVNSERSRAGLKPLQVDIRLVATARAKSQDMIANKYFGHQSPTLGSPFDQMRKAGIAYRYAGENLAGAPSVTSAHNRLMNSPGHRANILNPNFTHIGVGIISGGPYGKMFTQQFIGL